MSAVADIRKLSPGEDTLPVRPSAAPRTSGRSLRQRVSGAYLTGMRILVGLQLYRAPAARDLSAPAIVAPLGRNNGISQGARLQHAAFLACGSDPALVDATATLRNPLARPAHNPARTYIFHVGGPQTASLMNGMLPYVADARRIAYWAWELPDPPSDWRACGRLVDEIWTPSAYSAASLSKMFDLPIRVVPHIVSMAPMRQRADGPFTVLVMADSRSSFTRKNPRGAVTAFRRAFGERSDVRLLVKLNGGGAMVDELAREVEAMPNARVLREFLDDAALQALYRSADVFVSTHRAEGFGLPMLEAMSHGIPVVATGWSGNLEFMSAEDSILLPATTIPVDDEAGVYMESSWADPDLDAASEALVRLERDRAFYDGLAKSAYRAAERANDPLRWLAQIAD